MTVHLFIQYVNPAQYSSVCLPCVHSESAPANNLVMETYNSSIQQTATTCHAGYLGTSRARLRLLLMRNGYT